MKVYRWTGWSSALCLGVITLQAQETAKLEQMEKALQQMQRVVEEQQQQIQQLRSELQAMKAAPSPGAIAPPGHRADVAEAPTTAGAVSAEEVAELRQRVDSLSERAKQTPKSIFNSARKDPVWPLQSGRVMGLTGRARRGAAFSGRR